MTKMYNSLKLVLKKFIVSEHGQTLMMSRVGEAAIADNVRTPWPPED